MAKCYWGRGQWAAWDREQSTRVRNNASSTQTCLSEGSVLPWKTSMTCPGEQASPSVGSEKQVKAASSRSNSLKKYFVSFPVKANNRINQHWDANQTWASLAGGMFSLILWEPFADGPLLTAASVSTETSWRQLLLALHLRASPQLHTVSRSALSG